MLLESLLPRTVHEHIMRNGCHFLDLIEVTVFYDYVMIQDSWLSEPFTEYYLKVHTSDILHIENL